MVCHKDGWRATLSEAIHNHRTLSKPPLTHTHNFSRSQVTGPHINGHPQRPPQLSAPILINPQAPNHTHHPLAIPQPPRANQVPPPPTFAQVLCRGHQEPCYTNNIPPPPGPPQTYNNCNKTNQNGNFRPAIPPLMSLALGYGTYRGGA